MVYLAFPGTKKPGEGWVQRVSLQLFPGFMRPQRPTREVIPWYDYALAIIAGMGALYMAWDYVNIIQRSGLPIQRDVIIGAILVVLLLEAARRALGPALPILAILFLLYCFAGPYMPSFIAHPGVPLEFVVDHMYLSDSGIWGVPIGVSTSFVFLFVLFGSLLDKAGAANYFVQVAFAALGRFRGGPAKAAVVASGMTGLVSGSSIANVATTGTFTIPLMKKVGLPDYKAGAVEVAASTNGQLMPPVMGAAAFIMAEFLGLAYLDVVRAAILPALLSYIALFYVVHLEALKLDLRPLEADELPAVLEHAHQRHPLRRSHPGADLHAGYPAHVGGDVGLQRDSADHGDHRGPASHAKHHRRPARHETGEGRRPPAGVCSAKRISMNSKIASGTGCSQASARASATCGRG